MRPGTEPRGHGGAERQHRRCDSHTARVFLRDAVKAGVFLGRRIGSIGAGVLSLAKWAVPPASLSSSARLRTVWLWPL
ncbi:hypothetical protein HaLaN_09491 [Haematococcus lacustris]|uniref:Uncharacterized protein n=1 Tax=Haematococcus lacustris TaxID=44745 RepID=A0A699Z3U1_HAELA|nr:hypothetical protein HaLaN_09491 [Haematococcus lacustris]